ncbi:transcriptional regulatory protein [Klebsiella aerogenes]|nr:transcriptional regulatory protein [Klebsiella aerogenes]
MPMKFKQIQAFITVAHEGNMTLAAEKMGITQSGLSRLLLSLEADLSATLFERHKHGMALSEYGSAFLPYALTMLNTEQKAREEIALIRGAGKVSCGLAVFPAC